jgi:hypothetical protein
VYKIIKESLNMIGKKGKNLTFGKGLGWQGRKANRKKNEG